MQGRPLGLQKVLLAPQTLELAPAPTVGIAIGPNILPPRPAPIGTGGMRTELLRAVHLPWPSRGGGKQRRWDTWCGRARRQGRLTSGTGGFAGEPRKRLRISRAFVQRCGGPADGRARGRAISCPPLIQEDTQPREA